MARTPCNHLVPSIVSAAIASLCGSQDAAAQCASYSIDVISGPACQNEPAYAELRAVNEAGAVCGGYAECNGTPRPFIWSPSTGFTLIPPHPTFGPMYPYDLNLTGQVAGWLDISTLTPPDRAARFADGAISNLGTLPGDNWSQAYAINDDGVVCGASNNTATGPLKAFAWQNGKMSALSLTYGVASVANDISNSGKVCGWMGNNQFTDSHAFIHDLSSGITIDAGVLLTDSTGSWATGINEAGSICGWSYLPCSVMCGGRKSFIWNAGAVQDLGVLPGFTRTFAYDLNSSNTVVGHCDQFPAGTAEAFVWHNGVMNALNDLIPSGSQLDIRIAWSINNAGQIAAEAIKLDGSGDHVGVRLTPIPSMPGDYNCDRIVNTADLLGVINHWNIAGDNPADFNHDNIVNALDLMIVIQNWAQ